MRIAGKSISGPNEETVVLPRGDDFIAFKCKAVLDYTEFETLVPEVKPPLKTIKGGKTIPDLEDKDFLKSGQDRGLRRFEYMIIKSLEATPDLEWDTVKLSDPTTWKNLEKELTGSGIAPAEVGLIFQGVTTANGMNEDKLKEGRARFFAMTAEKVANSLSPMAEPVNT